MNFNIKMDDSKISLDLTDTRLKNVLQYCKPKEQLKDKVHGGVSKDDSARLSLPSNWNLEPRRRS